MTALNYSEIKIIRSALYNCNCRVIIIICVVLLLLYCKLICNWPSAYIFINCIYSFFPHLKSLHILFKYLQIWKYINCIINCNIVPYSYFLHVLSLHILYIQLLTVSKTEQCNPLDVVLWDIFIMFKSAVIPVITYCESYL
jgi:hypothetical protein